MAGRLQGKRAFLTAAGQGIGRATAIAFANEGAHVIATDVDVEKLKGLSEEGVAETFGLDVLDSEAVKQMAAALDPIDVMFNCAGFVHHGTVLDCDEKSWDFSFDLNVKSMHRTISSFLPKMIENGGGSIVNMASAASTIKAAPNRYVYGATKAAVMGLTRSVAVDFISKNIRCNAICPGTVRSPSLEERIAELGKEVGGTDKAMEMFVARQLMGRLADASEIAALVVYLASDESAFVTGVSVPIDGGWTL